MPGRIEIPAHTSLTALPIAVLDLETTGLDVRTDRIVQIAVIHMQGADVRLPPRIEQLIDPGVPIPEVSTGIHGIDDNRVAGSPRFEDYVDELRDALSERVVVGHHVAFDLAVLRYAADRAGVVWHEPPSLDLARLIGALRPALADFGLETVADMLGVEIRGRHTALGDCRASAEGFARLLPMLRDAGVRTLGEARVLSRRRNDLYTREVQSGWHSVPGDPPPVPADLSKRLDSFVFSKRIEELMHSPPVVVAPDTALLAAAETMVEKRVGALLVGTSGGPPEGIVTERDLLRIVAERHGELRDIRVGEIMTRPVETIAPNRLLYRALGRMDRLGIRHLCVRDEEGGALGMISHRDLLHHRARASVVLGDALHEATDPTSLAAAFSQVPSVAAQLVSDGLRGYEVAHVISTEVCALTARAEGIARRRLTSSGREPPATPWCLLVLGSAGRGESLLSADQDNALIALEADSGDKWFADLGRDVAEVLDTAGLKLCDGGVMASNIAWRGSREEWRQRVAGWLRRARPEDLLNVDIFFDLVPVAGDTGLAARPAGGRRQCGVEFTGLPQSAGAIRCRPDAAFFPARSAAERGRAGRSQTRRTAAPGELRSRRGPAPGIDGPIDAGAPSPGCRSGTYVE